ncbi:AsmA-like C-terminal region-containing protein [Runella sp.]|uniref:AsmA-like C-terminal region-containing protein n=1 Tax=Runella sp. TaxID=1960881 RepID=UPI003D11870C
MLFSKIIKIALYIFGALVVLMGGVLVWAYQYRDDAFQYILKQANQNVNGQFTAKDFGFTPFANGFGFTFSLFDVHLQDTAYARHHTELLSLQKLTIQIDAKSLFKKEFQVKSVCFTEGKIDIFVDKNGYSNLSIFQSRDTSTANKKKDPTAINNLLRNLHDVCIKNVSFSLQNFPKNQRIAFKAEELTNNVHLRDTLWEMDLEGEVYFEGLAFNKKRGAFLENKPAELDMNLTFSSQTSFLRVFPSKVKVDDDTFELKGSFDLAPEGHARLEIKTDTINAARALTIVPKRLADRISQFKILPVVTATVRMDAPLFRRADPAVSIDFQTKAFNYESPIGPITDVMATGHFTNQANPDLPTSDKNSRISAKEITGLFYGSVPLNTVFTVTDFEEPFLSMEGNFKAQLVQLNGLFDENHFKLNAGKAVVSYCYNGKMNPIFNDKTNKLNGKLDGHAKLENAAFTYFPQKMTFNRMYSSIRFNEKNVDVSYLHFNHRRNQIRISGKVTGLLPYAFNSSEKVDGYIALYTPDWGLDWIRDYHRPSTQKNQKFFTKLIAKIAAQLELDAVVIAKKVHYRKFEAENVKGRIHFSDRAIKCEDVKMHAFGGDFLVTGGIDNFDQPVHRLYAKGKVTHADVKKVFYAFENFGQNTISDRNLSGEISTDFAYSSQLTSAFKLVPASMTGRLAFELSKGELNHFEPIKRIQRIFFRRRDFDNVRFENLKNQFVLQGEELNMEQMKVASSVLTFFVGGTYSFRDKTDLLVQVPLSNLKRDVNDTVNHNLSGNNLVIRALDEKGEIKLKYQLDWRKKTRRNNRSDSLLVN